MVRLEKGLSTAMNARIVGSGKEAIVLAHGYGGDQSLWDKILPCLAERYRVLVFDWSFSGAVNDQNLFDPVKYSSFDSFADDLISLLEEMNLSSSVLVGHSMSGIIGCIASIKRPELFKSLILIGASPRCWKKQLSIAKDARRVDVLCHRMFLSYRLLDGTSRFKQLHEIVTDAKTKLETEVGPVNGVSSKMARGIVSRLSVAGDVHKLCSLAIEKADEWLATISNRNPNCGEGSLPAACGFLFEEVTSSSVVIVLTEISTASSDDTKGYKLWYCKSETRHILKNLFVSFQKSREGFRFPICSRAEVVPFVNSRESAWILDFAF